MSAQVFRMLLVMAALLVTALLGGIGHPHYITPASGYDNQSLSAGWNGGQ